MSKSHTRLNLLISPVTHRKLRLLAAERGVTMSALVRQAIDNMLDGGRDVRA